MRKIIVAVVGLWFASAAGAQGPSWRFDWKKGQELRYRVEHTTTVSETVGKTTEKTSSKLNLLKQWKVLDVTDGVATLELTLLTMRNEQTRPNGEVLLFDSTQPDKSTPLLKEHMAKFIG